MKLGNIKSNKTFEQIAPAYRGKPQAEKLFYMFSQAYYKTEQYLAGYQFESFASGYPKSEKSTGCLFRSEELFYVVTYL
jgi:outer membrane protein assembly factor BamD (BamD/ComL family)